MKIWYAIRRPIGYALAVSLGIIVLLLAHALPIVTTDAILGI